MEERKTRWRMVEKAREERAKGNWMFVDNRRIWVNGRAWRWDTGEEKWYEVVGESGEESE